MQNMVVYKRVCLVYSRYFRLFIYLFLTYSRKSAKLIVNEGEYCRATPFAVSSYLTISSLFMLSNAIATWRVFLFYILVLDTERKKKYNKRIIFQKGG